MGRTPDAALFLSVYTFVTGKREEKKGLPNATHNRGVQAYVIRIKQSGRAAMGR